MKLKTLLLGSAAAMIAVTGARAADAIVAEPEPVEYVKVCDMYGAGYFYIPGTETCIRFSGLVRSTFTHDTDQQTVAAVVASRVFVGVGIAPPAGAVIDAATTTASGSVYDVPASAAVRDSVSTWTYRARLNVQTANETDYGTLTSIIRLQGDGNGGSDADVGIDRALIGLGGFRLGYTDQYWATNHGYGTPGPINDTPSGFDQAIILDYTYTANGLAVTVGVQDEVGTANAVEDPGLYAGLNYGASWGNFAATLGYDTLNSNAAGRVSLTLNVIDGLTIKGLYAGVFDSGDVNQFVGSDYEWGVGVNYQATDAINVYASYFDNDTIDGAGGVIGANYAFASGIRIQGEVTFREDSEQEYRLRVQRSF